VEHFKGKPPLTHVIEARRRGKIASSEIHGTELPGHMGAAMDAAKETAFIVFLLYTLLPDEHLFVLFFLFGYLLWKTGRSAILGWNRLERMHRVIEEERWEIEHCRPQEKEELKAFYEAKGLSGKLLSEVVDVLMADDNRLLQVMLEEELGLNLESHEHPLKQAFGAFLGVIGSALITLFSLFFLPSWGLIAASSFVIALSAAITAKLERNRLFPSMIWNLAVLLLAILSTHFFQKALS
jgi:vacuolar iron transporter family protein